MYHALLIKSMRKIILKQVTCSAIWELLYKDDDLRASHGLLNSDFLNVTRADSPKTYKMHYEQFYERYKGLREGT